MTRSRDQTTHFGYQSVPLDDKQGRVNDVFRSVASRYDLMNDLMSAGLHRTWKQALVTALRPPRRRAFRHLDVAGGTGDVAFRVLDAGGALTHVTVLDINGDMLAVGRERAGARYVGRIAFVEGNAEALPLGDNSLDGYTIAFGIRNVPRIKAALKEAYRVLKRGGHFLCLEFSNVDMPGLDKLYDAYSFNVIPAMGGLVTGDAESYRYLVESIRRFPPRAAFARMVAEAGFQRVTHRPLTGGIVAIHSGWKIYVIGGIVHLARNLRAGFVLAREGALALVDPNVLPPSARILLRLARTIERRRAGDGPARLSAALTRLGPSYVKVGQFLATRPDIVGVVVARDLESLQDRMPAFPRDEAARMVEIALGRPLDVLFSEFSEPVAAASIAQVHRARTRTPGAERIVAVKVMRPGVREQFARDLQAMRFAARHFERFVPDARRLRAQEVVETLARSVSIEMDLRLEAAAMSEFSDNTREDADFRVPRPEWDLTERDVLTAEWIDAIPLHDLADIDAAGVDREALARIVIQSFLKHAIRDGFFHADMHPGNLFVDREGRLVAVDFGIMGRLGMKERRFLAEILLGFIRRDYRRVAEVHFEAGYVPGHHAVDDFAQAIRAIGEPIHDRRADEISMARLLTLLFEVTALFDMATRTELVMLQKTMVVVEGVARTLDPKLDIWRTSEPVVREWIERNLGPIGRIEDAAGGLSTLVSAVSRLPEIALRSERVLAKLERAADEGFPLAADSLEGIGRAEARRARWQAAALWVLALCGIVLVWHVV